MAVLSARGDRSPCQLILFRETEGIVPGHDGVIFPLPTSQTIIYIRRIWKFAQALLPVSGIVSSGTHARHVILGDAGPLYIVMTTGRRVQMCIVTLGSWAQHIAASPCLRAIPISN
ncbi:uncharacterized protein LOC116933482 [Daphnia magna]|uniref:uncharacterized protein LOC116933482 n=1 Tax=Daphnia magna TaxID=35525 RepID=UPI001E1BD497|nr:uncharacterized protein LOC116933482 [Daphnia magna]